MMDDYDAGEALYFDDYSPVSVGVGEGPSLSDYAMLPDVMYSDLGNPLALVDGAPMLLEDYYDQNVMPVEDYAVWGGPTADDYRYLINFSSPSNGDAFDLNYVASTDPVAAAMMRMGIPPSSDHVVSGESAYGKEREDDSAPRRVELGRGERYDPRTNTIYVTKEEDPFSLTKEGGGINWQNLLRLGLAGFGALGSYNSAKKANSLAEQSAAQNQAIMQGALNNYAAAQQRPSKYTLPGGYASLTPADVRFKPLA